MVTSAPELHALNTAPPAAFVAALGPLFEAAPRFLARLAAERPFEDWEGLFGIGRAIAQVMPEAEQVELVNAHPRLGAAPETVSAMSSREQGYGKPTIPGGRPTGSLPEDGDRHIGAPDDARQVAAELARLNDAYEARFRFRYCVFVAGRPLSALLPGMRAALEADRAAELHRALDAVVDIAQARLAALQGGAA